MIERIAVSPKLIWPPLHQMIGVSLAVQVSEEVDAAPITRIIAVTSNEPENGLGDGDMAPDFVVTGDLTATVRAERAGTGSGRVYSITVESRDASGNAGTKSIDVTVPHDPGQP